jgi:hypothetical protein
MNLQSLEQTFTTSLHWHPARIHTFVELIFACLKARTVKIKELAMNIGDGETLNAKIVKIERFFLHQKIDFIALGKIILQILNTKEKVYIAIDRTNWQFGKENLNFFVAGIVWGNISIPFAWMLLDKKGNSSTDERKALIEDILKIVPLEKIEVILADREFVGEEWLRFLDSHKELPFAIRVKKNEQITHENGGKIKLKDYFSNIKPKEFSTVETKLYKTPVKITCLGLEREHLFLASNVFVGKEALGAYKQRWSIERSFKSMKTSGFNMEDTHMTDQKKLAKLFAILAFSLTLWVIMGGIRNQITPIVIKKHGRHLYCLFTYGFDLLRDYFCNVKNAYLRPLINLFQSYLLLGFE